MCFPKLQLNVPENNFHKRPFRRLRFQECPRSFVESTQNRTNFPIMVGRMTLPHLTPNPKARRGSSPLQKATSISTEDKSVTYTKRRMPVARASASAAGRWSLQGQCRLGMVCHQVCKRVVYPNTEVLWGKQRVEDATLSSGKIIQMKLFDVVGGYGYRWCKAELTHTVNGQQNQPYDAVDGVDIFCQPFIIKSNGITCGVRLDGRHKLAHRQRTDWCTFDTSYSACAAPR